MNLKMLEQTPVRNANSMRNNGKWITHEAAYFRIKVYV